MVKAGEPFPLRKADRKNQTRHVEERVWMKRDDKFDINGHKIADCRSCILSEWNVEKIIVGEGEGEWVKETWLESNAHA